MKKLTILIVLLAFTFGFVFSDVSKNDYQQEKFVEGGSSSTVGNPPVILGLANEGGLSDGSISV